MERETENILKEPAVAYLTELSEEERLKRDVYRSDMDKLKLFTQMLRNNKILKKAVITHK
ncbi:MAG: hypothetical protein EOO98_15525 [Pedobacter sp.]|nr:MAG: hypothetical protein EOO98_15525 [Pedobacter sp.]